MNKSTRHALWLALLAGSAVCLTAPSYAQSSHSSFHGHAHGAPPAGSAPHWGGSHYSGPHVSFAAHADFGHFSPAQHAAWVGGRWNHGWRNGHFGWWWFAGGAWFFYGAPIYPYPLYVSDEYVDDYSDDYSGGYGGQYWYYCQHPAGYYPYVQQCSMPWQPVPPTPPPPPPGGGYGPPPGYQQGPGDQGPPPGYQGPPPGYQQGPDDQGPPPNDDRYPDYQGPPPGGPGPGNQGPPPGPGNGPNN